MGTTEQAGEYRVSRAGWPAGPWDAEPEDRIEWRDDATGLPCLMVRPDHGAWCGYVAVPPGHPWHGRDAEEVFADVHGGLTYASACGGHVCHVPRAGEPADVWWLGFDCVHSGDAAPGHMRLDRLRALRSWETYRTAAYVRGECASRAAQAHAARTP